MTMKILVLIPLVFGIVSSERSNSCVGTVIGATWHFGGNLPYKVLPDLARCQEYCNTFSECKGFTWVQEKVLSWCSQVG